MFNCHILEPMDTTLMTFNNIVIDVKGHKLRHTNISLAFKTTPVRCLTKDILMVLWCPKHFSITQQKYFE